MFLQPTRARAARRNQPALGARARQTAQAAQRRPAHREPTRLRLPGSPSSPRPSHGLASDRHGRRTPRPAGQLPEVDDLVLAAGSEELPIGAEAHTADSALVGPEREDQLAALGIPDLDGT